MILITKCPHCQTSFRVTEDQLKLYDGAVRCGVCQQIFNGVNHLQAEPPVLTDKLKTAEKKRTESVPGESNPASAGNLSGKEPEKANAPAETTERHSDDIAISLSDEAINTPTESEALFDALEEELSTISLELGQVTGQLFGNEPEDKKKEVIAPAAKQRIVDNEIIGEKKGAFKPPVKAATTRFTSLSPHPSLNTSTKNTVYSTAPHLDDVTNISPSTTIEAEVVEPDEHLAPARHQRVQRPSLHDADPLMDKEDRHHPAFFEMAEEGNADNDFNTSEPSFVRLGRKKKRFGFFSGVFLGLATLVLLATLAIQCLYMFSDRIVVWWPPAESTVAKACNTFSCPRRLETRISSLSIESSEFQVIPPLTDKYALSLLVRNSGSSYQSWPYIELTLNDKDKTPIVRRAFAPANYLPDAERIIKGIPPYSEEPVRLYLEIKTAADADYRISLFYP
ncbi:MAG: DUF3426 domain-containing protein [Betaproteobacteria bacterium]|nr:DUF3426 domain-containing protein [Betaproteobacteria bacterium]